MARRSTRDESIAAENQAVRLFVRGYSDGEIAGVLGLSESEARRKRLLGMERRSQEAKETSAWSRLEAELLEVQRVAYRDHDEAAKGSPARVGCLRVIVDLNMRRARLYGLDLEQSEATQQQATGEAQPTSTGPDDIRDAIRDLGERNRLDARGAIEIERAAGPENVCPPEPETDGTPGETA